VPVIFISHSAKSDADTKYLEAIADGLPPKFEVWLDRLNLQGGDDWNNKIGNHLLYCEGAVLLVSKQSLESPYVQHELSNLIVRWRRERDPRTGEPGFPLVPVLLSAEVLDDLDKRFFGAIKVKDIQCISPKSAPEVVQELLQIFGRLPQRNDSPFARLEEQIRANLRNVPVLALKDGATLSRLMAPTAIAPQEDPAQRTIARALVTCTLIQLYNFFRGVGTAIGREQRANIIELLLPSWVSYEAARSLDSSKAWLLNSKYPEFTPKLYLQRAAQTVGDLAGRLAVVQGVEMGELAPEKLLTDICAAMALALEVEPPSDPRDSNAELFQAIREAVRDVQERLMVVVPLAPTDLPLLIPFANNTHFEGVTFVALCSPLDEDVRRAARSAGVALVEPELQTLQEAAAQRQYSFRLIPLLQPRT
jgi:hypothetical protein